MNNLRVARRAKGLTQAEVATQIGLTQGSYSLWEGGKTKIDSTSLQKLADLFEVTTDYLLGAEKAPYPMHKGIRIPVLGSVAAGIPIDAIEDILDYEEIDEAMASTGEFFALRIKGHSMEPRMCDGDVVIIRKQEDVETGELAVVLVNGDSATVKKIKKGPNGIGLIPLNPSYEPTYYTPEEIESFPVSIIGKVVELRGKF